MTGEEYAAIRERLGSDPAAVSLAELTEMLVEDARRREVHERNVATVLAALSAGATSYPMARCPGCPGGSAGLVPVLDDGSAECPEHGVLHPPERDGDAS